MAREIRLIEDFKKLIVANAVYADKTNFIKEVMSKDVVLYTRPRRFGKTLNMSMLYYFFSNQEDSFNLFKDLNIAKDAEAMKHLNKYPVISISLKELSNRSFDNSISHFKSLISSYIDKNQYLLTSENISEVNRNKILKLYDETGDIADYQQSLKLLSDCLYTHFNEEVIILIDEYDVPLRYAHQYGYYDDMLDFIRPLFSSALKTNDYLFKGIMTGCLRIAKESVFTGLNNFRTDSILSYDDEVYFGFTEEEVKSILDEYDMPEKFKDIKDWYDGYLFGNIEVYNPWSALQYIDDAKNRDDLKPSSYWANTSGNDIIYDFLKHSDPALRNNFEKLVNGEAIEATIYPEMTYRELDDKEMIYSYLLITGYLKAIEKTDENKYKLMIPNKEIRYIYTSYFRKYIVSLQDTYSSKFCNSLIKGDANEAETELNDFLFKTVSFHDYGEDYYHGLIIGMLNNFELLSNREFGLGRPDIVAYNPKATLCIEIKKADRLKDLDKSADEAIRQIKDKKYVEGLKSSGYRNIKAYGIVFFDKSCCVKSM